MESKIYKTCGCECKNCNANSNTNSNIRKCKKCNFEGEVSLYFYKTGKVNSYRHTCKKCYSNENSKNRDKDLLYHENDFDDLPTEIKIKIFKLSLENSNIKKIARDVKCKYNMLWYAIKSKQVENFAKLYYRN